MSTIQSVEDNVSHATDATDLLWLARALEGEGGDRVAVGVTLLQRWILLGGERFAPFGEFIQAYCQPVSPLWLAQGAQCRPGGAGHGTAACSSARTSARARRRRKTWNQISQTARDAAVAVLYSTTAETLLPGAVHFGERNFVQRRMRAPIASQEVWQILPDRADGQAYVSTEDSRNGAGAVRVFPGPMDEINEAARIGTSGAGRRIAAPAAAAPARVAASSSASPLPFMLLGLGALGMVAAAKKRGAR